MYIYNIFPQFRTLAGGERLSLKILEEVAKLGHRVSFVTLSIDSTCLSEIPKEVEMVEIFPLLNRIKNHYLKVFLEHIFVYKTAKRIPNDANIIFFHKSSSLPALFYFKKIKKGKIPVVYFSFEPPRFAYDLQKETLSKLGLLGKAISLLLPIFRYLDWKFANMSDEIITYSQFMKEWLFSIYRKPINFIVPLGVELSDYLNPHPELVRSRYNITEEKVVITSNKLHPRKRVDLFIKSVALIKKEIPKLKALILGTGPEESSLKALSQKLNLEDTIIFCGHIGKEIPNYYAAADVYIHPGKNEPFGLSVIEAQISGIPVVAVREGEPLRTVIEGKTGLFADAAPEDIAEKVIYLLKRDELRKEMGKNAIEHVRKNYTWQISAQKFLAVCEKYQKGIC
ncbi:MAG: glycosyltransferase family 4 protein [candidate division WOR-3 bacterium]